MEIDNFIDETKAEQLTKLMAETLVNAEGIDLCGKLWRQVKISNSITWITNLPMGQLETKQDGW